MTDHTYTYLAPSMATTAPEQTQVMLATSGGRAPHPFFFHGFVDHAGTVAQALLSVVEVASTRYYDARATATFLDPVVTANGSVLRFESFSACNGVYSRFDLDADTLDGPLADWGTTNIDINPPLRSSLAMIADGDPMLLSVGRDEVVVATLEGRITEKKVPLPERWVRGLAEVGVAMAGMMLVHELPAAPARRLIRDLATRPGQGGMWLEFGPSGGRLTRNPSPTAIGLAGPGRLAALRRLVPRVRGLEVYAPPPAERRSPTSRAAARATHASAWAVELDGGRLVLALSPEERRGFSGEGGILEALAATPGDLLDNAAALLRGQPELRPPDIAAALDLDPDMALHVIRGLAGAGRVGYDLATESYFHRDLPYDRSAIDQMQPRLRSAQAIVDAGHVELAEDRVRVSSADAAYVVRFDADGISCTCPWFARHRGERGPCKHALAAAMARRRAAAETP